MFTYTLCVHIYSVNRVLRGDVPKINKGARVDVSDLPAEILFCGSIYFSITHLYDFFFCRANRLSASQIQNNNQTPQPHKQKHA